MKKYATIAIMLLVFGSKPADSATDEVSISVGGMSWYSTYNPISRIGGKDTPNTSSAFMSGLTMKAQYKDLYFGANYLLSTSNYELVATDNPIRIHHSAANSSASRSDVDLVIGYMLTPALSVTTGYKGIFVDDNITLNSKSGSADAKRYEMYNLGKLGLGLTIPFGSRFIWFIHGNTILGSYHNEVSYSANYNKLNTPDENIVAWGASAETNVNYKIINQLSVNAGLYGQYTKAGSDNSSFFGPTFGLEYKF